MLPFCDPLGHPMFVVQALKIEFHFPLSYKRLSVGRHGLFIMISFQMQLEQANLKLHGCPFVSCGMWIKQVFSCVAILCMLIHVVLQVCSVYE